MVCAYVTNNKVPWDIVIEIESEYSKTTKEKYSVAAVCLHALSQSFQRNTLQESHFGLKISEEIHTNTLYTQSIHSWY